MVFPRVYLILYQVPHVCAYFARESCIGGFLDCATAILAMSLSLLKSLKVLVPHSPSNLSDTCRLFLFVFFLSTNTPKEKATLAKELNDKSTVLAGVKDKTKAYVEKLNAEKATAIAALEEQVGIMHRRVYFWLRESPIS